MSSQRTEKLGGIAVVKNYDPSTGAFAVVSTTYPQPAGTGNCLLTNAAYDLSKGMGWYLTGTMTLPGVAPTPTPTPGTPGRADREGEGGQQGQGQGQDRAAEEGRAHQRRADGPRSRSPGRRRRPPRGATSSSQR